MNHFILAILLLTIIAATFGKHHHKHNKQPWQVQPGINRDEKGNVNAGVEIKNSGSNHEFEAGWNKVVRGPNKAKPSWHVGGTWRFKRSPEQVEVNRDKNLNVEEEIEGRRGLF